MEGGLATQGSSDSIVKPHPKEGKLWGEDGVGTRTESVYVFLLARV